MQNRSQFPAFGGNPRQSVVAGEIFAGDRHAARVEWTRKGFHGPSIPGRPVGFRGVRLSMVENKGYTNLKFGKWVLESRAATRLGAARMDAAKLLHTPQKLVVSFVRADPEPMELVASAIRDGAIGAAHIDGPNAALLLQPQ